jgi:hypothetical protein
MADPEQGKSRAIGGSLLPYAEVLETTITLDAVELVGNPAGVIQASSRQPGGLSSRRGTSTAGTHDKRDLSSINGGGDERKFYSLMVGVSKRLTVALQMRADAPRIVKGIDALGFPDIP